MKKLKIGGIELKTDSPALAKKLLELGVDPSDLENVLKKFLELLQSLGKGLCLLLEVFPSKEISFAITVSDTCVLEFTIKKR